MISWTLLAIVDPSGVICFWSDDKVRPSHIKTASYFEARSAKALVYWASSGELPPGWRWAGKAPEGRVDWTGIVEAAERTYYKRAV